jgi:hypothetical protein
MPPIVRLSVDVVLQGEDRVQSPPLIHALERCRECRRVVHRAFKDSSGRLSLTVQGETFEYLVVQGDVPNMTAEYWRENLRSLLVDFVSESRFGWGQNREAR